MRRPRICVVSGGPSGEADASRVSASAVYDALLASNQEVTWIDLDADGRWSVRAPHPEQGPVADEAAGRSPRSWDDGLVALLRRFAIELVFPVMHGDLGEDGQLQTLCRSISVPYVGSDPEPALRCYDKVAFKRTVAAAGLPTARGVCVERSHLESEGGDPATSVEHSIGYPCIVKPSRSGSSLGLARVESPDALPQALENAFRFDDAALIEELFPGADVELGVIGGALPTIGLPIGIQCDAPLYDFAAKYERGDSLEIPAALPDRMVAALMRAARTAYVCNGCRGLARVDFLVDGEGGRFVVNELNTIPYMTARSSFAESLRLATGRPYEELVAGIVDIAWMEHRAAQR